MNRQTITTLLVALLIGGGAYCVELARADTPEPTTPAPQDSGPDIIWLPFSHPALYNEDSGNQWYLVAETDPSTFDVPVTGLADLAVRQEHPNGSCRPGAELRVAELGTGQVSLDTSLETEIGPAAMPSPHNLVHAQVFGTSCDTVIFREDFDTSVGGMPDPDVWIVNHPGWCWWVQGRTHFPCPEPWLPTGEFPRVEDGVCVIEHHLYNPYDLGTPNTTFLGGEIHTILEFEPNRCYRFEASVRYYPHAPYVPYPNGLVTSFFLYGYDGSKSDEIDFEFVSNKTNDDVNYPNGDPVLTNPWNESSQKPQYAAPYGLDMTEWNTFRIYWDPELGQVCWSWVDPLNGETWLRTETDAFFVPDEPMALYFNFWAPDDDWPDACDEDLQPVDELNENEVCRYEIDYVEVCVISDLRCSCHCGDIDDSAGTVNLSDFGLFALCYGLSTPDLGIGCRQAYFDCSDMDGNGVVNLSDFGLFALWYGQVPTQTVPNCVPH